MSNEKESTNQNNRRQFRPEEKIKILRLHLLEKVPVSEVCEKHQITPTMFYQWQKIFFENGATVFAQRTKPQAASRAEQRVTTLENKLKRKDEVIAEIMADYIVLKKELGES